MKTLRDPSHVLANGLTAIREQFKVADAFPSDVIAEAEAAAARPLAGRADWTGRDFLTLDPASSTDLDQAFALESAGDAIVLHYAIADVGFFVDPGSAIEREAWNRGATAYLPDGRAGLYPPILSERAASLLPDGPRPAIVLSVSVAPDGTATLQTATPAVIRSRAKLAYETAQSEDLSPLVAQLAERMTRAEEARGASRVEAPEQEVEQLPDGRYALRFRPRRKIEDWNAMLSLASNLAVAQFLLDRHAGLFRVMGPPPPGAVARLRRTAKALGLDWPGALDLGRFEKTLDPSRAPDAAFIAAQRRTGEAAGYAAWSPGLKPWHVALAAAYAHASAPLRRLADRYVLDTVVALSAGQPVPDHATHAFAELPKIMARADSRDGAVDRAVVDLAEAVVLAGREGETFPAMVIDTDERGAKIQLSALPVIARLKQPGLTPGAELPVRLVGADPDRREVRFEPA